MYPEYSDTLTFPYYSILFLIFGLNFKWKYPSNTTSTKHINQAWKETYNNEKSNATYESSDARINNDCNRGIAFELSVEQIFGKE